MGAADKYEAEAEKRRRDAIRRMPFWTRVAFEMTTMAIPGIIVTIVLAAAFPGPVSAVAAWLKSLL